MLRFLAQVFYFSGVKQVITILSKGSPTMPQQPPTQPKLADLLARFLNQQAQAQKDGLTDLGSGTEVTPFDAGPVQAVDARLAWEGAVAAAAFFNPGVSAKDCPVPPQWGTLVADQEPAIALAFSLGNYPQMVRNFHLMLQKTLPTHVAPSPGRPVPALVDWANQVAAKKQYPHVPLALGTLRLAKNFEAARAFAIANNAAIPSAWRAAWDNEKMALDWHQGYSKVIIGWESMEPTVPVLFNRGMANLFLGNPAKARESLSEAIAKLPEANSWHHLARLYLALTAN
jgi:hypothetical protein